MNVAVGRLVQLPYKPNAVRRGGGQEDTQVENLCYWDTQVASLCYERPRGAARAREPALLSPRSQDGEAEKASSE